MSPNLIVICPAGIAEVPSIETLIILFTGSEIVHHGLTLIPGKVTSQMEVFSTKLLSPISKGKSISIKH